MSVLPQKGFSVQLTVNSLQLTVDSTMFSVQCSTHICSTQHCSLQTSSSFLVRNNGLFRVYSNHQIRDTHQHVSGRQPSTSHPLTYDSSTNHSLTRQNYTSNPTTYQSSTSHTLTYSVVYKSHTNIFSPLQVTH